MCITSILAGITVIGGIIVGTTIKISESLGRMKDPASTSRVFVFLTFPPNRFPRRRREPLNCTMMELLQTVPKQSGGGYQPLKSTPFRGLQGFSGSAS
jgi:hypothetical protein